MLDFNQLEIVNFEILFQNILYFIGISNTDINEENTNKLQWKKARKFWNGNVLEALKLYDPFGPKTTPVSSFAMVNRLIDIFNSTYLLIFSININVLY